MTTNIISEQKYRALISIFICIFYSNYADRSVPKYNRDTFDLLMIFLDQDRVKDATEIAEVSTDFILSNMQLNQVCSATSHGPFLICR